MDWREEAKKRAAYEATKYIRDGMVVGLGTGSTARYAIEKIGELTSEGYDIIGIPTSRQSEEIARRHGIKIGDINDYDDIDVTIDGADEIDKNLNLIKGGGGALLREKIVASCSRLEIIVADESKLVDIFSFPLPVEIVKFGWRRTAEKLKKLGLKPRRRDFVTDNGNYILDCEYDSLQYEMEEKINMLPGVVENGLFINMASFAIIGYKDGSIKIMEARK